MTLKSFNVWVIYQIIHDTLEHSMLIFFLTLESLNAEIYASFDTFALRCHNKRLNLISYYTAQNIACNRSFCRRLNECKSGAKDENDSSLNCDRRFHFFKAMSHTIAFCTRESVLFSFDSPQKRARNAL